MPRCTILYKNKQLTIIGEGREKLCVSSVTIIYEQINQCMPRADVVNDLETIRNHYFIFFQTEFTNCFIIQSVSFVCFVIYSILMPKTQTTLSKLGHTQSIFSSLIHSLFPSLFFCPWALTVLYFQQEEVFAKSPQFKKCISRHFSRLVKQEFHWNIFQLKLHYMLPIFSFMFH